MTTVTTVTDVPSAEARAAPDAPGAPAVPEFDLTARPWLPVLRRDGREDEVSLLEVFREAADIRRLVGDVPTQDFALLRLLLAILHDAVEGPEDAEAWRELWEDGLPLADIAGYLARHRHRFDLLHPETPFFQVPDLHTAKHDVSSLDRIVADVPNGERFFTMRARGASRLPFAEAARWVVHAHAFDPSGIKSGAVGDPRVKGGRGYPQGTGWAGSLGGICVTGDDLRETLLLNLVAADTGMLVVGEDDRPAWRRPQPGAAPLRNAEMRDRPSGLRDLYTWQSRRLRLHHDGESVHGVVLAYGDPLSARNMYDYEPMTGWRRSPAQEKKLGQPQMYLPREHDPARSAWRGLGALLTGRAPGGETRGEAPRIVQPRILEWVARLTTEECLPEQYFIRARLVSAVYGTQQSVIDELVDDSVVMSVVLLHKQNHSLGTAAISAVDDAESAVYALGELATGIARAAGAADPDKPRDAARARGFAELDAHYRGWLEKLRPGDDPDERRAAWQETAHHAISDIGRELLRDAGTAAWEGRVESTSSGSVWLSASRADLWFRRALRRALPLARGSGEPEETPGEPRGPGEDSEEGDV